MTFNSVITIILRYFAEFGSFRGQLRKRGLISHQQIFYREMSYSTLTKHDGRAVLFAVAEVLVLHNDIAAVGLPNQIIAWATVAWGPCGSAPLQLQRTGRNGEESLASMSHMPGVLMLMRNGH